MAKNLNPNSTFSSIPRESGGKSCENVLIIEALDARARLKKSRSVVLAGTASANGGGSTVIQDMPRTNMHYKI